MVKQGHRCNDGIDKGHDFTDEAAALPPGIRLLDARMLDMCT